jgi:subtilisin family serine protease
MNKKLTITVLSIFGVFVILLVGYFVWLFNTSGSTPVEEIAELDSIYISEDSKVAQLKVSLEEEIEVEENINPSKTGELSTNEDRKVITFNKELTDEEKTDYEEQYNIQFTDDQSVKGTYSVLTTEASNIVDLEKDENVGGVETDIPVKMFTDTIDWGVVRVGASNVWAEGSGAGVPVAIIDTGIQINHPDLANNIVSGYDFVNNDTSGNDDNGHGTHVAGIVAATMNGSGSVGASYSAKLMPIKVLNESGYGYLSDVAKGIYYAADNGARIINMSLGTSYDSDTLRNAVQYAANKGVLIVAAAGNDYGSPCSYPAAYSSVICVVATDQDNKLAGFSNVGGELAAPGVSNYSTYLNSTYAKLSGTSMASPHIAGSAAVVMSVCTDCSTSETREILRNSATDLGAVDYDIIFGYGLVNLVEAIESILPEEDPVVEEPIEETPTEEDEEDINEEPNTGDDQQPNEQPEQSKPNEEKTPPGQTPDTEYYLTITNPETNPSRRYIQRTREDIELKFEVLPSSSTVNSYEIYINNEKVEEYDGTTTTYIFDIDELNSIQYDIRVEAKLNDGSGINDSILLDLTHLSKGRPSQSVKGVADFRNWIVRLFFY